jgi:hypothetical protein
LSNDNKPKKHEGLSTVVFYLASGATLVGVVLSLDAIPTPTNEYLAATVGLVYAIAIISVYLGGGVSRTPRTALLRRAPTILSYFTIVNGCALVVSCLYLLYNSGDLWGRYDVLVAFAEALPPQYRLPIVDVLPTVYRGIIMGLVGVAMGTSSIALFAYERGLLRARKRIRENRSADAYPYPPKGRTY